MSIRQREPTAPFLKVDAGTLIPVPGGKRIEALFGRVHTGIEAFSLARMTDPPGWTEPEQNPTFDELTIVLAGRIHRDHRVRYGNPFTEPAHYLALCFPAFSPDGPRRSQH